MRIFAAVIVMLVSTVHLASSESLPCKEGTYCPSGATKERMCEAGYECINPTLRRQCDPGDYCEAGTVTAVACPIGKILHYFLNNLVFYFYLYNMIIWLLSLYFFNGY